MNVMHLFMRETSSQPLFHTEPEGGALSRTQLLQNVGRTAHALRALGVEADDCVLVLPGNSTEALESILAIISLGAVAVPVNPRFSAAALARVLEEARPRLAIVEEWPDSPTWELLDGRCTDVVVIGPLPDGRARRVVHRYHVLREQYPSSLQPVARLNEDAALLLHTSGSTGLPKRICRTHGELAAFVEFNHFLFTQYAAEGVPNPLITVAPLSHLSAIGYCLEGLFGDTPVHLLRNFDAARVANLIERLRCRFLILVPSLYELILHEIEKHPERDLSSLRFCVYGGEACPTELAARISARLQARPIAAYGLTECMVGIAHRRAELESGSYRDGSCGRHLMGEIRLVDAEGRDSAERGELWVRNGTIPRSARFGGPDPRLTPDGWFRTGDVLRRDADGCFFHAGRIDDMFPCNGNNVYPAEVEAILLTHPAVAAACLAPVKNRRGHVIPAALVRPTSPVERADLLQFARARGPAYAMPAFIDFAGELPHAPSGKLDRVAIKKLLQHSYDAQSGEPHVAAV